MTRKLPLAPWKRGTVRWFESVRDMANGTTVLWDGAGGQRLQQIDSADGEPVALVWADEGDPECDAAIEAILAAGAGKRPQATVWLAPRGHTEDSDPRNPTPRYLVWKAKNIIEPRARVGGGYQLPDDVQAMIDDGVEVIIQNG